MSCIYCKGDISTSKGREHVLPQFLGTFTPVSLILKEVCDKCNSTFSRELEDLFKKDTQEGLLASQMRLRKDSRIILSGQRMTEHSDDPTDDGIFDRFVPEIDLATGNTLPRDQLVLEFENGQRQVLFADDPKFTENVKRFAAAKCMKYISAKSPDRLAELEEEMRHAGMPYKKLAQREIDERDLRAIANRNVTQKIDASICRLPAKIGFNYFAHWMKELGKLDICYSSSFDNVRDFALHGTGSNPVTVTSDELMSQDGWVPRTAPIHILLWRRESSYAIAEINLFALRRYSVRLGQLPKELMDLAGKGHYFDLQTKRIRDLEVVFGNPPVVPEKRAFQWRVDVGPQ